MKIFYQASIAGVSLVILFAVAFYIFSPKTSSTSIAMDSLKPGAAEAVAQASFYDLQEKVQPLAQWQGKVMVVNFWATWCPPCIAEIPEFIKLQKKYGKQDVQFVGIAIDQKTRCKLLPQRLG
jgi:thiol-disulfide isomerase/thioredoxin